MLPLARELLQQGTIVVLAANSQPAINDITAPELLEAVQRAAQLDPVIRRAVLEDALIVVPSGNDLPVIDLRKVLLPAHKCAITCVRAGHTATNIASSLQAFKCILCQRHFSGKPNISCARRCPRR